MLAGRCRYKNRHWFTKTIRVHGLTSLTRIFKSPRARNDRFAELIKPHLGSMYRMGYRWTRNREEAEDLVQDVVVRLLSRTEEVFRVEKLRPWLIRVLYRRYVDLYRRRVNSPVDYNHGCNDDDLYNPRSGESDTTLQRLELQWTLNKALNALEAFQRDVILLHDVEGHSALDVADILDISVGTVKSRLHRARKKLKIALEVEPFDSLIRVQG